jgi:hypothetical protein
VQKGQHIDALIQSGKICKISIYATSKIKEEEEVEEKSK